VKHSLVPFKILVMLLYGTYACVQWNEGVVRRSCRIETNKLAKILKSDSTKVRRHVRWLERMGYLSDVQIGQGYITLVLKEHA
jgi:hypothetical protein